MDKIAFIVWARYHRRSELLAQHLGATIHYVYYGEMGRLSQAPTRYLAQAWQTWRLLREEHPDVVFVQNPPIFAVLVVALYARCYGARYVIDSHTGAFLSSKWRWSTGLHRILSRGALATIVHNESQGRLVRPWKCPYCVIAFTPGDYPAGDSFPLSDKFNVAVICGFDSDEPLEILFEAAACLSEVTFYVTGDAKRLAPRLLRKKPANICLTGYLPYERYVALLRGVSGIIDLVNNEHTMLMGAFEAVSLGVPLIVSDWPLLRDYFCLGTVHVSNTVEDISAGVRRVQREHDQLQREMLLLKGQLEIEWIRRFTKLQKLLSEH